MTFDAIYQFFAHPTISYLTPEQAVCYVLSVLIKRDSYGTELIQLIERNYATYRLSDTILYQALQFLEREKMVDGYWQKVQGRGRPRRMYQICPDRQEQAADLARLWEDYIAVRPQKLTPELQVAGVN